MEATMQWPRDTLSVDELRMLIERPAAPCVSLFLPLEQGGPARQQNPIRLQNMLREAEKRLMARGLDATSAHALLASVYQGIEDRSFWEHQGAGLAIFVATDLSCAYWLPQAFEGLVIVDTHTHITPLLPLLRDDSPFYLLALGLGGVRLLKVTRNGMMAVELKGAPTSLRESLAYDEFAKQPQFHPGVPGRGGERGVIFHGQGARDEALAKQQILRYFQQVDHGVSQALRREQAPLLLAGIAYLLPIYRAATSYAPLLADDIAVNPDDLPAEELHARAWSIMVQHFDRARDEAVERYRALRGTRPELATSYLRAIIPATHIGRVDTLFLAAGQRVWGDYDPASGSLTVHEDAGPRDAELLNLAAVQTLRHGGAVTVIGPEQMPEAAPIAAIFRY
jgi:hypothetical protein